jgi:hypothetical protein
MSVLRAARAVDLPDWYVGAGVIRNVAWDYLHGYAVPMPLADVDIVFFDPQDLTPERDAAAEAHLRAQMPQIPWQAKNQASVHLWYPRVFGHAVEPLTSSEDAIGTWPEMATCVGVRLLPDDTLSIAAPCGLDDLVQMVLRRNPRRVTVELFHKRLHDKRIREKWPRVQIIGG